MSAGTRGPGGGARGARYRAPRTPRPGERPGRSRRATRQPRPGWSCPARHTLPRAGSSSCLCVPTGAAPDTPLCCADFKPLPAFHTSGPPPAPPQPQALHFAFRGTGACSQPREKTRVSRGHLLALGCRTSCESFIISDPCFIGVPCEFNNALFFPNCPTRMHRSECMLWSSINGDSFSAA